MMPDWLDKLFTPTTPNDKELQAHYGWQQRDTAYEWYGNGMLKSVRTPEGATIRFEYDALGRRTLKETHDTCHRYAWDGNVLLHEWSYNRREKPRMEKDELGRIRYDRPEPYTNLITWVYDGGSYTPVAKLTEEDSYSIVQDYLGTPIQALDSKGEVVWDCILDIYGEVFRLRGKRDFIPFRFQGQYEDGETGLYYNRFRYYSPHTGNYISQDPIRLAGNNPTLYGYVNDANAWIDPFGLDLHHIIPQQVYRQFKTAFNSVDEHIQNVSKKAADTSNLIDLDKLFHGNHPKYNDYIRGKVQGLIDADSLNLNEIRRLQEEMLEHISNARKSGLNLNDYFKEGLHLRISSCK